MQTSAIKPAKRSIPSAVHQYMGKQRYGSYLHMVSLSGPLDGLDRKVGSAFNEPRVSRGKWHMSGGKAWWVEYGECTAARQSWQATPLAKRRCVLVVDRWSSYLDHGPEFFLLPRSHPRPPSLPMSPQLRTECVAVGGARTANKRALADD